MHTPSDPQTCPDSRDDWADEVRLETVRSLAEQERHTLFANIVGLFGCLVAAIMLPFDEQLFIALALRAVSIVTTRLLAIQLRAKLAAGEDFEASLRAVTYSLAFGGFTWAALLWPVIGYLEQGGFSFVILGVAIVGVSLICAMLGALPMMLFGFLASFTVSLFAGLALQPGPVSWAILLASASMAGGMIMFSMGMARQNIQMSEALVSNRRLGEDLCEALEHAEFLSLHDSMTGLKNRRAFFEVEGHLAPSGERRHILAIDLDYFKTINDTHGHAVGDRVIVQCAQVLRDFARMTPGGPHCAVRLGGEEFLLLLTGQEYVTAKAVAEAVRHRIAAIDMSYLVKGLTVSASIGFAECAPQQPLEKALLAADKALYEAKQSGRDRVMQAVPEQRAA
ncbi:GGDEF domain-containing protein [Qipengyuania atrilutea]|uniref:diguanylate cyclase n=1 Tax=Qipengyuania atrilutea TaxID=2744473 RepID=A0A850GXK5_9SPHN|nr:GGDEF domain-containing protein [Actirhodobacter atriluteus]NVD44324.1 GGDEF domain-containing protein [Actirhodobacter atriluteus]